MPCMLLASQSLLLYKSANEICITAIPFAYCIPSYPRRGFPQPILSEKTRDKSFKQEGVIVEDWLVRTILIIIA